MTTAQSNIRQDALRVALRAYEKALSEKLNIDINTEQERTFEALINRLAAGQTSPAAQRLAFDQVRAAVIALNDSFVVDADEDLTMRQHAREIAGLELFPSATTFAETSTEITTKLSSKRAERMLDVEVIGIYW